MDWPAERVYFAITIILSLIGWTGLARVVRGRFLSLRKEDFVMAAKLDGASQPRAVRGGEISMIFQEPMTSLSPIHLSAALILAARKQVIMES